MYAHPTGRPCFTSELLADVVAQQREVELAQGTVDFFLNCSSIPGVYNLGGDLDLFRRLVEAGDQQALMTYAEACIRAINNNVAGLHADAVSMSVIQGDALGGGLEAALSCHVVIAERGTQDGLPGNDVQPVSGHGRIQSGGAQGRAAHCRGPDPERTCADCGRDACARTDRPSGGSGSGRKPLHAP
jgi:enoyl-CoA hydratase/carnithine racemase